MKSDVWQMQNKAGSDPNDSQKKKKKPLQVPNVSWRARLLQPPSAMCVIALTKSTIVSPASVHSTVIRHGDVGIGW